MVASGDRLSPTEAAAETKPPFVSPHGGEPPVRERSALAYCKKGFQRGMKSPFEKLYIILKFEIPLPQR